MIPPHCDEYSSTLTLVQGTLSNAHLRTCTLRPHRECALFVAWQGVLVLVYEGFPECLKKAKQYVEQCVPDLITENFGSKWPKTTLAAMHPDAPDWSLEELVKLQDICHYFSSRISTLQIEFQIKSLSVVEYEWRGLERIRSRKDIELESSSTASDHDIVNRKELDIVNGVVHEWQDVATINNYLAKVNVPGSRIDSYRSSDYDGGMTLVTFLDPLPEILRELLHEFREVIFKEFPDRYVWLDETSLHCTLRSLRK